MSLGHSLSVVTDGLLVYYDQANIKSYKGPVIDNMVSLTVNTGTAAGFSSTSGTEIVNIPGLGSTSVTYNLIQNNYPTTSTACCPVLFSYRNGFIASSSTLYTYAIVYKCESGYTNPNFMYRYEYTANGGALVTEAGVHNTTNRIHLGNGWYWAWNTFTTGATTNWFGLLAAFYYQYSTTADKFTVAKVLLTKGDYTALHPKHWPPLLSTRNNTQSLVDLTNQKLITVTSATYTTSGVLQFSTSTDQVSFTNSTLTNSTFEFVFTKLPSGTATYPTFYNQVGQNNTNGFHWIFINGTSDLYCQYNNGTAYFNCSWASVFADNITVHCVLVFNYSKQTVSFYKNGVLQSSTQALTSATSIASATAYIGTYQGNTGNTYSLKGTLPLFKIYNRALNETEVKRNFNAIRGRYGL